MENKEKPKQTESSVAGRSRPTNSQALQLINDISVSARRSQRLTLRSNAASTSDRSKSNARKSSGKRIVVEASRLPFTLRCPVVNSVILLNLPNIPSDVVNIDEMPLAAGQIFDRHYGREILCYMKQLEVLRCLPRNYMATDDGEIITYKIRGILCDWIIQVQHYLELSQEALHLCIKMIDNFFATKCKPAPDRLQLVAVASLLISCKMVERYSPKIATLIHLTDDAYTNVEVLKMEKIILNALNFNLVLPDPVVFLDRCFQVSGARNMQLKFLSQFLVDLMLPNVKSVHVLPSLIAAASFCLSKKILFKGEEAEWNKNYMFYSGYDEDSLKSMMQIMTLEVIEMRSSPLKGAMEKYSSRSRYQNVCGLFQLKPESMKKHL